MLLRLACSYINRQYDNQNRPITIKKANIESVQDDVDIELAYYFKHVVSEIQQFYPEEYEMFELLASGQISDFIELSVIVEYTKHLYSYGLVDKDENGIPFVKMPVAGRYVAMELAKKENRKSIYKVIEKERRNDWVTQRQKSIVRDLRQLELAIRGANCDKLFGENSFPEAEKFAAITPVSSEVEFEIFFNICNRCFVESIENYVKSTHNRRERPVCGHRGRSRGPFYYRITTFGKGPWDARDPHKTTFMALKHVIRLSIWQRQKETPGVEKAPGVSSPQRKESGRSGRDDGELRFGYDPAIHARRLRVYHRPRRLRMASRISIFFAARRFEPLNSMG